MKIAVVALGKIGLPLAVQFANKGHQVIGCDVNQNTVDLVNKGIEPFPGEAHLGEYLKKVVSEGKYSIIELDPSHSSGKRNMFS